MYIYTHTHTACGYIYIYVHTQVCLYVYTYRASEHGADLRCRDSGGPSLTFLQPTILTTLGSKR